MNNLISLRIELTEEGLGIYFTKDGHEIYFIERFEFCRVRGNGLSEWVAQLEPKSWLSNSDLVTVARLIQQSCPNSSIDWDLTFRYIKNRREQHPDWDYMK